jgi:hypothetical protein
MPKKPTSFFKKINSNQEPFYKNIFFFLCLVLSYITLILAQKAAKHDHIERKNKNKHKEGVTSDQSVVLNAIPLVPFLCNPSFIPQSQHCPNRHCSLELTRI